MYKSINVPFNNDEAELYEWYKLTYPYNGSRVLKDFIASLKNGEASVVHNPAEEKKAETAMILYEKYFSFLKSQYPSDTDYISCVPDVVNAIGTLTDIIWKKYPDYYSVVINRFVDEHYTIAVHAGVNKIEVKK